MPIPFLNSIKLNKNQVEDFCVFNYSGDPTLSSGADFGYLWLNTSATPKVLKFWDGTNYRTLIDSTTISSATAGTANDLSGGVAGSLPYQQGVGDTTFLGIGSSGYILTSTGSAPQWSASIPSSSVSGLAASATTDTTNASNISSGTLGLARLSLASGQFYVGDGSNNPAATAKSSIPLSGFGAAGADVAMGGFKITGLADPAAATDAATRGYVDSVAQGLDVKASCLVATTTDITLASPGAVTIDGIYSATDFTAGTTRILVKDQSASAENGIYIWQGPAAAMTRSADANTWDELVGAFTFVERGTANADSGWVCTVNAGGTLGSTAVTWVKFSQAGSYTAGNGIVQSGTSFNFAQSSAYTAGQIPFAGGTLGTSSTTIGFDSNFVWDDQANRLGIGTAAPATALHVFGTGSQALSVERDGATIQSRLEIVSGNSTNLIRATVAKDLLVEQGTGTEVIRIATNGVCTWSNVGGVAGTAMTLNGTGLGIGVSPSYKLDVNSSTLSGQLRIFGSNQNSITIGNADGTSGNGFLLGRSYTSNNANDFFIFDLTASAPRFAIDSSGNVGIGTTTPGGKLEVFLTSTSDPSIRLRYNSTSVYANHLMNGGGDYVVESPAANGVTSGNMRLRAGATFSIATNNSAATSPQLSLDTAGNLGLGVTPSAWQANWKVLQFANGSSIGNPFNGEGTFVGSNAYRNSSGDYIRLDTGYAAMYMQLSGSHRWHVAGTSTAGSTIPSFSPGSQAMTLDASGNLLVGTASASGSLTVVGAQSVDGSTYYVASLAANNSPVAGRGSGLAFRTNVGSFTPVICAIEGVKENGTTDDYASALDFSTRVNGGLMTKRLRIKSTGQVNFVGLASDPAGAAGDLYFNSTDSRLRVYDATSWKQIARKYSTALSGDPGTVFTVTHNLGTRDVSVSVRKSGSTYDQVFTDVAMTNSNTVTITFASSVTPADYTVTVIG